MVKEGMSYERKKAEKAEDQKIFPGAETGNAHGAERT